MMRSWFLILIVLLTATPLLVTAQQSQTLSVTPPLFQISVVPNQQWQSSVKIVNPNDFELTVFATPVLAEPRGEQGEVSFIPVFTSETQGQTFPEWISITDEAIVIPAEQSVDIAFTINVPENPPPGGHFAAILVGTQPNSDSGSMVVQTSQLVSTLLFLRVSGQVEEAGTIREFSVSDSFVERPGAEFLLRFQNDGNVHVRPQGDIRIYNMWGKERGIIPINQNANFGNVLPDSIRQFSFSWTGERSLSDIGRYTAEVTLGYGQEARHTKTRTVSFYVIPLKATIVLLAVITVLVLLVRWALKSYVRFMLLQAGIDPDERAESKARGDVLMFKRVARRTQAKQTEVGEQTENASQSLTMWQRYRAFIIGVPSLVVLIGIFLWFVFNGLTSERGYEITIDGPRGTVTTNSEELKRTAPSVAPEAQIEQAFELSVVNVSGDSGAAAQVADQLTASEYVVSNVAPDLERIANSTVVVTTPDALTAAQEISQQLGEVLISIGAASSTPQITVFVGKDYDSLHISVTE